MAKLTALENLQSAIRTAAAEGEPKATGREVAAKLYDDDPELIRQFEQGWVIEKLASLIAKYRLKVRRDQDLQYQLGFGHMPRRISLRSGKVVARDEATIGGLRALAVQLRARRHPALDEVEKAIALMSKYTGKGKGKLQRITWGEVLQREAGKQSSTGGATV